LLVDQGEGYKKENEALTDLSRKMLDYEYLTPLDTTKIISGQSFSKEILFEFSNEVKILRDQIETYVNTLHELLARAVNIITLIQRHYHLK